jgi:hypothetical protein
MTSTSIGTSASDTRRRSAVTPARAIALIFMVGQFVSLLMFTLFSPASLDSGAQFSPTVPPEPMFAIWSVIFALSAAWSVVQLRPSTRGDAVRDALSWPLAATFAGVAIWQGAAALGQSNGLTLPPFVLIVAALVVAMRTALHSRDRIATWPRWERALLFSLLGIYLGWTSIAIFVNVATVVQASGAPIDGAWGTIWQSLVLLAAAGVAVFITRWTGGAFAYAATTIYAFSGAAISTAASGFPALTAVCVLAIVSVTMTLVVSRLSRRRVERSL